MSTAAPILLILRRRVPSPAPSIAIPGSPAVPILLLLRSRSKATAVTRAPLIREAVIAGLTGDAGVSSLIGPRVFPGIVPQSQLRPALTVHLLNDTPGRNLSGFNGTSTARILFTAVSKLLSDDQAIAEAVRNFADALSNADLGGLPILFAYLDPEADDYSDPGDGTGRADIRTTMTYLIRYRRALPTRS